MVFLIYLPVYRLTSLIENRMFIISYQLTLRFRARNFSSLLHGCVFIVVENNEAMNEILFLYYSMRLRNNLRTVVVDEFDNGRLNEGEIAI